MFCEKREKNIKIFLLKIVTFTAVKIAVYHIGIIS